jgi:NADPH:quinone reductase-like Zn-dependent oxidoreductase
METNVDLAEGEVLVHVHATSVNPIDRQMPFVSLRDVSGVVEIVGPGVTRFQAGDAVFGIADGAYTQYMIAKERGLALKPRSIDHVRAAAIPLASLTAWQALFELANLKEGQRILVHGAAGGVGTFAVQLAKWKGAWVAGTASQRNQVFLMVLGVDQAIDYENQRFEDAVSNVDVVLDTVGGELQQRSWSVLRKHGILVSTASQPSPEEAAVREMTSATFMPRRDTAQLAQIAELVGSGHVRPMVETILPLSEVKRAHEISGVDYTRGKIVLTAA